MRQHLTTKTKFPLLDCDETTLIWQDRVIITGKEKEKHLMKNVHMYKPSQRHRRCDFGECQRRRKWASESNRWGYEKTNWKHSHAAGVFIFRNVSESSDPDSVRSGGFQVGPVRGAQLPRSSAFPPARWGARLAGDQHLAEDRIPSAPGAGSDSKQPLMSSWNVCRRTFFCVF